MTLCKIWNTDSRGLVRTKPFAGDNGDYLDNINDQAAEAQRAEHEAGECAGLDDHCPHCEADKQAELEARHYERHVFDRLANIFKGRHT